MLGYIENVQHRLSLLGYPRVEAVQLPTHKPVYLLLYLAYRGDWIRREELAPLFWPETDDSNARHNLRLLIHRAKALDWAKGLEVEASRLRWQVETDVKAFRQAIGRGDWAAAVALHQSPLCTAFPVAEAPGFEAWLELEREALSRAWREASFKHAQQSPPAKAAAVLQTVLAYNPLDEEALSLYLEQAYLVGQREEALRQYQAFCVQLQQELDLEPMPQTQQLAQRFRQTTAPEVELPVRSSSSQIPLNVLRPPVLVGRHHQQQAIARSQSPVVLVGGVAGVGKTRLLSEALPEARVLHCREGLENLPYYPVLEYLRKHPVPQVGAYQADLARLWPEASSEPPPPGDALTAKPRLLEALRRALEHQPQPLVFDDLQWADAATLELLIYLAQSARLRLGATYRSNEVGSELHKTLQALLGLGALHLTLDHLNLEETQTFLCQLIEAPQPPPHFSRWLWERSGGNPFFVLETLKSLFESGVLEATAQGWRSGLDEITQDYSELEIPPKVTQLIERRLSRLAPATRRVLQALSVAQVLHPPALAAMLGLSELEIAERLEEAELVGLVGSEGFTHDLLRQSIYRSLPKARRSLLHASAAQSLQGQAEPLVLAQHWLEGGQPQAAVKLWLEAAKDLQQRGHYAQALGVFHKAQQVGPSLEVSVCMADSLMALGRYTEARQYLEPTFLHLPPGELQLQAYSVLVYLALREGRLAESLKAARTLSELAQAYPQWQVRALLAQANAAAMAGQQAEVLPLLQAQLQQLRSQPPSALLASAHSNTAWLMCGLGRYSEALPLYLEAVRIAKAAPDNYWTVWASANLLYCCLELGQPLQALPQAEAALHLGEFDATEILRINLGKAYLDLGQLEAAAAMFEGVVSSLDPSNRCVVFGYLAHVYAQLGRAPQSQESLEQVLRTAQNTDIGRAKVRALIAVLNYGNPAQKALALPWLHGLERRAIPGYVWRELEAALASNQLQH